MQIAVMSNIPVIYLLRLLSKHGIENTLYTFLSNKAQYYLPNLNILLKFIQLIHNSSIYLNMLFNYEILYLYLSNSMILMAWLFQLKNSLEASGVETSSIEVPDIVSWFSLLMLW
jgi:hypothetical protein